MWLVVDEDGRVGAEQAAHARVGDLVRATHIEPAQVGAAPAQGDEAAVGHTTASIERKLGQAAE